MDEIWKKIKNFEDYEVSNLGRIRSLKRSKQKIMSLKFDTKKYNIIGLCMNGKLSTKKVHRLVAEAFISNPKNKATVNHIDGNKTNNKVDNLEWLTNEENMAHAAKLGLKKQKKGLESKQMKLSLEDILNIRDLYESTQGKPYKERYSYSKLAKKYNVDATTIMNIIKKQKYYKFI